MTSCAVFLRYTLKLSLASLAGIRRWRLSESLSSLTGAPTRFCTYIESRTERSEYERPYVREYARTEDFRALSKQGHRRLASVGELVNWSTEVLKNPISRFRSTEGSEEYRNEGPEACRSIQNSIEVHRSLKRRIRLPLVESCCFSFFYGVLGDAPVTRRGRASIN